MIYIHIPFCRSFCTYCGFYSELAGDGNSLQEAFAEAVCREYSLRKGERTDSPDTLYIGGGTPSVLPFSVLSRIVDAVADESGPCSLDEFTVEVNPDDIVRGGQGYAEALLAMGADRISMGVQSFDDGILKWMNRRHSAKDAEEALRILRQAGFRNISVDLIFGIAQMDDRMWNAVLDRLLTSDYGPPEHISAYQLSVEPDSALDRLVSCGRYREASEDLCSGQYGILCSRLAEAGYRHYEVSNFAIPGHEAVHNSAYWTGAPYLGLGPGAHSYLVDGSRHIRSWNIPSVRKYIGAFSSEEGYCPDGVKGSEILTEEQMNIERIMLSLRTDTGIPEADLRRMGDADGTDRMLEAGDLVRTEGGRVRIPEDRFFISDSIIRELV